MNTQTTQREAIVPHRLVRRFRCRSKGHEFECAKVDLPSVCPVCRKENGGESPGIWLSLYDEVSSLPNNKSTNADGNGK